MSLKIFVTGHQGYIGAHLVTILKNHGHTVTGCDVGLYTDTAYGHLTAPDIELQMDYRNLTANHLEGHDVVMHLAALSNDPLGELDAEITYNINRDGSIRLAKLAKKTGVSRYLFSGSCSVYGAGMKMDLKEGDPLEPLTTYAKSKVQTEKLLSEIADENFCPVYLRNATAYGISPMLRLDLVVNNLLSSALAYKEIRVMSDGMAWRPLVHCYDIARAFLAFAEAPIEKIYNKAFNIGDNLENFQVKEIAQLIAEVVPNTEVVYADHATADSRNYRVNFDLLNQTIPTFKLKYNLALGISELYESMLRNDFSQYEFESDTYYRLRILKKRMHLLC